MLLVTVGVLRVCEGVEDKGARYIEGLEEGRGGVEVSEGIEGLEEGRGGLRKDLPLPNGPPTSFSPGY